MSEAQCPRYEGCDAPLCPLQAGLGNHVWYPGEAICPLRKYTSLSWVRKQRRIQALPEADADGFFTVAMLETISKVRKGLMGASPDDGHFADKRWLEARAMAEAARERHRSGPESPEPQEIASNPPCERRAARQLALSALGLASRNSDSVDWSVGQLGRRSPLFRARLTVLRDSVGRRYVTLESDPLASTSTASW